MKVVKEGRLDRLERARRFGCRKCGCVFDATAAEYRQEPDCRNGMMIVCNCPTCGHRVTLSEGEGMLR